MKILATTSLILLSLFSATAQSIPSKEIQIASALSAAPEEDRLNATVKGYDQSGILITLQQGSNKLICLTDNPKQEGFNAACYHEGLEVFMARGRELKAQGQDRGQIFQMREDEAKSGKLKMPDHPSALHIRSGPNGQYNPSTKKVENTTLRYVVYIPWATSESTGLPIRPLVPGGPWIMDPGTHRAHIMISPPKELQK
jgi:hypothetical protein